MCFRKLLFSHDVLQKLSTWAVIAMFKKQHKRDFLNPMSYLTCVITSMKKYSEMLWRECHKEMFYYTVLVLILLNFREIVHAVCPESPQTGGYSQVTTISTRPPQSANSWRQDSCTEAFKRHLLADTRDLSTDIRGLCWGSKLLSMFTCVKKATMFRIQTVTVHFFSKCLGLF